MVKYISILRGINVGGKRKILMADLKAIYQNLRLENVQTYIQSGNVVFELKEAREEAQLVSEIQQAIHLKYGFDVPVLVRTQTSWADTVANNPFLNSHSTEQLHVTFLAEVPTAATTSALEKVNKQGDEYELTARDFYLACEGKYSQSKFSNTLLEKKLKVQATTRNWKTVLKLLEM